MCWQWYQWVFNVKLFLKLINHWICLQLLGVCRKITNYQYIRRRLLIYLCLVLIGGILNDFAPLILRSFIYKTQKSNVLNQWFVKIGWFWTTILTFPFMALTSFVLSSDKLKPIDSNQSNSNNTLIKVKRILSLLRTRQLLRLLINSLVWFISTNLFVYFEDYTGSCLTTEEESKPLFPYFWILSNFYELPPIFGKHSILLSFNSVVTQNR